MNSVQPVLKVLEPWLERSCQTLGTILGQGVQAGPAQGTVVPRAELEARLPERYLAFPCNFAGTLPGSMLLALSHQDAATLVNLLSGGDGSGQLEELTGLHTDVLAETMQQVVAALPGALTQAVRRSIQARMEEPRHNRLPELGSGGMALLHFPLFLTGGADLELLAVMPEVVASALAPPAAPTATPPPVMAPPPMMAPPPAMGAAPSLNPPPVMSPPPVMAPPPMMAAPPAQAPAPVPQAAYAPPAPQYERPHFESVDPRKEKSESARLDTIMDVPLKVTVVLGRTEVLLGDLVTLGEGSVLELDKLAGENVELYVRDRLVAYGEVIVVEERFGVKIVSLAEERPPQFRGRLRG